MIGALNKSLFFMGCLTLCAVVNCSFITNHDATQCKTTPDCTARGPEFKGLICSDQGVCVKEGGCGSNQECITANGGKPFICRKADRTCISLETEACKPTLAEPGDVANDDTVWLGSILPITGDDSGFGLSLQASIDLARQEWRDVAKGLAPVSLGGNRRPIAVVACDQEKNPEAIANYLVNDLKVPAIMGPAYSSIALTLVPLTVAKGTLLMGVPTTSDLLTGIPSSNPRLFWRTTPADSFQSKGIAKYVAEIAEPRVRARLVGTAKTEPLRLAISYRDDIYGQGIVESLATLGIVNGKPFADPSNAALIKRFNHGNPETSANPAAQYESVAAQIVAFQPHILVMIGFADDTLAMITPIEKNWTATTFRTEIIGSSGIDDLATFESPDPTYKSRVIKFALGARAVNPAYARFADLYKAKIKDVELTSDAAFAYDAFYALAYAMAQAGEQPLTGVNVARGMEKLSSGAIVNVGISNLFNGLTFAANKQPFNLEGASGPLDWNNNTGDVNGDVDTSCIKDNPVRFESSGVFYNAVADVIQGTRSADCK